MKTENVRLLEFIFIEYIYSTIIIKMIKGNIITEYVM